MREVLFGPSSRALAKERLCFASGVVGNKANVVESGCTIHFVDEGMDTGPIIAQRKFLLIKGESFEDFKKRGLLIENQFYPEVLEKLLKDYL